MSTTPGYEAGSDVGAPARRREVAEPEGYGWLLFAGIVLVIVAVLNMIYGIAAIDGANFFVGGADFVISDLETWGWVTLIIGVVQLIAALSIWRGGQFGRWFGIGTAGLSSIAALLSIPAYPFWSLAIFAVDMLIIYGLAAYGGQKVADY
jgi:hypothetical protein